MADFLKEQGNRLFKEENFPEADRLYASAIQLEPHNAVLYSNRAMTLIKLMDWTTCIQVCEAGLAQTSDPKTTVKLHWRKGIAQAKAQQFDNAKISYQQALQIDGNNSMVLKSMEELKTAESQFKRSHSVDEKVPEKRAKTFESIPIYEVDELPLEFRDPSAKSSTRTTPTTATPKSPTPQNQTAALVQTIPQPTLAQSLKPSFFPETPTLHQLTTIIKSPSSQSYTYIFNLSPQTLETLFSTGCIEPSILNFVMDSCIYTINYDPTQHNAMTALKLMDTLSNAPRFSLVYLFCDKSKLENLQQLLANVPQIDQSQVQASTQKWK